MQSIGVGKRVFGVLLRAAIAGLVAGAALVAGAKDARAACYVAFVHGKREAKPTVAQVNAYWNPDPATTTYSFPFWSSDNKGCKKVIVRWNSSVSYTVAVDDVLNQLSSFITTNNIPNGQLILIAHSMGGLMSRYILNNPIYGGNWAKVANATKYLITSQTPHLGSKGADVVAFEAGGGLYGDIISVLALLSQGRSGSSDAMRRVEMEYGSTLGGWMNDVSRTKRIYTIEGYRTGSLAGPTSGVGSQNTSNLDLAWGSMCYKPHWINASQCTTVTPGDGLVESASARAQYYRSGTWDGTRNGGAGPTNYYPNDLSLASCVAAGWPLGSALCKTWTRNQYVSGARVRWIEYGGDHQQGAWDRWSTNVRNFVTGVSETAYLASYIGRNGHTLTP